MILFISTASFPIAVSVFFTVVSMALFIIALFASDRDESWAILFFLSAVIGAFASALAWIGWVTYRLISLLL